MPHCSEPELLVLHGVRIQGFTTPARIAERFALAESTVAELLLDFEAFGWVRRDAFGESSGWSLTERGRDEAARRLQPNWLRPEPATPSWRATASSCH